jgi:cyanate permease
MTVIASAIGPLLLAASVDATGSYASAFYVLAACVALLAGAALVVRIPAGAMAAVTP